VATFLSCTSRGFPFSSDHICRRKYYYSKQSYTRRRPMRDDIGSPWRIHSNSRRFSGNTLQFYCTLHLINRSLLCINRKQLQTWRGKITNPNAYMHNGKTLLHTFAADPYKFDLLCCLIDTGHADVNAPSLPMSVRGYLKPKTRMNPWIAAYPSNRWKNEPSNRWKNEPNYYLDNSIHNYTPLFEVKRAKLFNKSLWML
jgi:hypothetical protein